MRLAREADLIAHAVYVRAGCSEEQPPGPARLLRQLVADERIAFSPGPVIVRRGDDGEFFVSLPTGLTPAKLCVGIGLALARIGIFYECPERASDKRLLQLSAMAILMPAPAVSLTVQVYGPRTEAVARTFVVPESVAASRLRAMRMPLASGEYMRPAWRDAG